MRFLSGLLKCISILLLVLGTVACTLLIVVVGIMDNAPEAILVGAGAYLFVVFVSLNILGTGMALNRIVKLTRRVEQLEQQRWTVPNTPAVTAVAAGDAGAVTEAAQPAAIADIPAVPAAKKKGLKPWAIVLIVVAVLAVLAGGVLMLLRGLSVDEAVSDTEPEDSVTAVFDDTELASEEVCPITIQGICVDDSYEDKDGKPLKMVYLFYTLSAQDSNMEIDSKYTQMYIGSNQYTSDNFADSAVACKFAENYYYGSYIRDVYVGDSMNVAATFYVPEGDLEGGKTVTFSDTQIPGLENLTMTTDEFMHFGDPEEIAMIMDPEGYESITYKRADADMETTYMVRDMLNGYCWSFYVNNLSYELEFWANNNFCVRTAFSSQSGTYRVQNGFIFCTYPDTGYTIEIPYEIVDGKLNLDTIGGFDVMG